MNVYLKGLLSAAIGGAAGVLTPLVADPQHFNFSGDGLKRLAMAAAVGALTAVLAYLKQSPIEPKPDPNVIPSKVGS